MIDTIMLFSAGLGNRMRHLTQNRPKSLIPILNKPILHYALELCLSYPFKRIVINKHYLHEQIEESVQDFLRKNSNRNLPEIITIYEEELLETGGGVKNAINLVGPDPIFTLNTDVIITCPNNIFEQMINCWDRQKMDFLLLLKSINEIDNYSGFGDFDLLSDGRIDRSDRNDKYPYIYTGLQILCPEIIARNPLRVFSLREYYFNNTKVYGMPLDDLKWYHASSPEDIVDIEVGML